MSIFDQRKRPPGDYSEGPSQSVRTATDTLQDNRSPRQKQTQYDRVLRVLVERGEACGAVVFYGEMAIPRFSVHLNRARKRGVVWSKKPCDIHDHEDTQWIYFLESVPQPPEGESCAACGGRLGHQSTCPGRRDPNSLPGIG